MWPFTWWKRRKEAKARQQHEQEELERRELEQQVERQRAMIDEPQLRRMIYTKYGRRSIATPTQKPDESKKKKEVERSDDFDTALATSLLIASTRMSESPSPAIVSTFEPGGGSYGGGGATASWDSSSSSSSSSSDSSSSPSSSSSE